ncbi:MAG: coenzyme F420-0:L-glutamate ligase [Candidatus Bathyarchaeia archaeon]
MVNKYKAVTVATRYWRPREDYLKQIVNSIENRVEDGDFVTISEKAISTALGNLVDESHVRPSWFARFLAKYWMRFVWPYILGHLCHLRKRTIQRLRAYPVEEGSAHKQVALEHAGFLQALMQGSEGAIDGSNLPYSYVSLPLKNAQQIAQKIQKHIKSMLGKKVIVIIVDTDKTYSLKGFHFTPRPKPIKGIHSFGGFLAYVMGRFFKLERRATPVAVAGSEIGVEEAIEIAKIANRSRGFGAGRTVWDMAENFRVPLTGVTWEMLDKVEHQPIVIVKFMHK